MRVRNNGTANASYRNNKSSTPRILIPAGSVLELDDTVWKDYKEICGFDVKKDNLTITKSPIPTSEEKKVIKEKALVDAKELLKDSKEAS